MNSKERHEIRYQRRVAARQAKRIAYSESFGRYEDVFSYEHLYQAGKNCCKGVMWKNSTQSYMSRITTNTASTHDALLRREFRSRGFHDFDLIERGKLRHIRSVHISERVVQRCLCDNILVPVFSHSFVFDNAASLKGKGVDFAMDRLDRHLHRFYRKFGVEGVESGGVLTGDFPISLTVRRTLLSIEKRNAGYMTMMCVVLPASSWRTSEMLVLDLAVRCRR